MRRRMIQERRVWALGGALLIAGVGCGEQVFAHNGLTALMQANGGQFYPGLPPDGLDGGIPVTALNLNDDAFYPGQINFSFGGQLAEGAQAVLRLYFQGDIGLLDAGPLLGTRFQCSGAR